MFHGEQGRGGWRAPCCIDWWVCCPITQPYIKLVIWFEESLRVPPRNEDNKLGEKKCCQINLLDATPVDTSGWGRGCAVIGINEMPLDQAGFSELHCLLFTTFDQGRQANCAWASGSRQRSTLSSPKTRVFKQDPWFQISRNQPCCNVYRQQSSSYSVWDVMAVTEGASVKLQRQLKVHKVQISNLTNSLGWRS